MRLGETMNKLTIFSAFSIVIIAFNLRMGYAALFSSDRLDPAFCNLKTVRQTVIYIDDMMMVDGTSEWALKINAKLKASLMPGERVTVVRLSPANARSDEIWTGCWPNYTDDQRARFAKETYLLSRNPLDTIGDQQKFFINEFGTALTKIYLNAKRPDASVRFSVSQPPQKQILRALASDEGRFSSSPTTIRAIIYSDMMENSDLATVFKPPPDPMPNYSDKLGSHLRRSVFYAFGVAEDVTNGQSVQDTAKAFWGTALKMLNSTLGGFGADLNVSNQIPVSESAYSLQLNFDETLDGKMSLLVDVDGYLVDSWIGFSRLSIAGLSGTFRCQDGTCKLDGATSSGIATNSPTELVRLSGKASNMDGDLGIAGKNTMLFVLKATLPN
jgi:hypothetical protein